MAFTPRGPEASFFEVLDQHRASLLAALKRGGEEPTGGGMCLASSSEVLSSIEKIIQDIVTSLARNEAPAFTIDNRSSWENIKFEDSVGLHMVSHCTTRKIKSDSPKSVKNFDIYYTDSQLFGNQTVVDNIINDISCMLKVPRRSLHILKHTCLKFISLNFTDLITDAKFLLIVEKDATFQRLLDDNFCNKMSPCIMVTVYYLLLPQLPDECTTLLLVKKLWDTFHIPVFTLVDADPHAHNLTVPAIRWLGLLPSDIKRLNIPKGTLIPLTKRDQMKLDSILKRPYITCQPFWRKEVCFFLKCKCHMEIMADSKMKAEIQALTFLSSDYLSRVYLPNKLKFGGWI
ncbi:hypothetical protein MJG53_020904 [Ovis ammon polii x Ovis aries]|uniref:DNA topoisomerase (ATP-hydrolyzing) n=2 Tax=Ovis TaxID=9935 RepID=A0AAD4U4X3_OVIAM|nr:hypothetical protein MG293_011760 [Ovis ammon polii]KAI4562847.1 hypothetical protein MJT46_019857 [Ovis ammon polii x Ovis aries]KAI4575967.1 hypothetical protein MJG53_020904 [Ovis ammon polii x Ovis aries]